MNVTAPENMDKRTSHYFRKSCADWYFIKERDVSNWPARQRVYGRFLGRYGVKITSRNAARIRRALDTIEGGFRDG